MSDYRALPGGEAAGEAGGVSYQRSLHELRRRPLVVVNVSFSISLPIVQVLEIVLIGCALECRQL